MPNGAKLMTQRTTMEAASAISDMAFFVTSPACFSAMPNTTAQNRIPI